MSTTKSLARSLGDVCTRAYAYVIEKKGVRVYTCNFARVWEIGGGGGGGGGGEYLEEKSGLLLPTSDTEVLEHYSVWLQLHLVRITPQKAPLNLFSEHCMFFVL